MPVSKYKDTYPEEFIRLSCEGKSLAQVAACWRIDRQTVRAWSNDLTKPEFMESYKIGRTCSEAYWEDIGQKGMKGLLQKFAPAPWIYMMKCRYKEDWTEVSNQKIELKNEVSTMSTKEIDDMIKILLSQRASNKEKKTDDSNTSTDS